MSIQALNWVFKQDEITNSGAKFVLTILANYADESGRCYPGQETIAKLTAITERTVRSHLEWLETNGYITKTARRLKNRRISDEYQLEFDAPKGVLVGSAEVVPDDLPENIAGSDEPEEIAASNPSEPENNVVSTGNLCQFEPEKFASPPTPPYMDNHLIEPSEHTQETRSSVPSPAAASEPEKAKFVARQPTRGLNMPTDSLNRSITTDFGPYRDAFEDWWCQVKGIITLPPNAETAVHVSWLFENKFTLAEIKDYYKHVTTDPKETWRAGSIQIGTIVKGIADWKLSKKQSAAPATVDFSHCPECDTNGMKQITVDGETRLTKCRHEAVKEAA